MPNSAVGDVHAPFRERNRSGHGPRPGVGQGLQLAVAVGHAHRAGVVALGQQQFEGHLRYFAAVGVRLDVHALADLGGAGGQQLGHAGHFHQAQPAGPDVVDAFEVAQRGDPDARFGGGLQDGRTVGGADSLPSMVRVFADIEFGHGCRGGGWASTGCRAEFIRCNRAAYSLRKKRSVLRTGIGRRLAEPAQAGVFDHVAQFLELGEVAAGGLPPDDLVQEMVASATVPARQGTHLPQDSSMQNSMKKRATSTMSVAWSITIIPPEPMMEPSLMRDS